MEKINYENTAKSELALAEEFYQYETPIERGTNAIAKATAYALLGILEQLKEQNRIASYGKGIPECKTQNQ